MDTTSSTPEVIACAACEETDAGPWKEIDGIYLCEGCIGIADGAK